MIKFEVPFEYKEEHYVALVSRDRPLPDFVSVRSPNNLFLPSMFSILAKKINGFAVLDTHPGLALKISTAIYEYCQDIIHRPEEAPQPFIFRLLTA